jgi:hypothetical protein
MSASTNGWIGSTGCPTTKTGAWIRRRSLDDGASRPKITPCSTDAIESARWSTVSRQIPAQNGTRPRGIERDTRCRVLAVTGT